MRVGLVTGERAIELKDFPEPAVSPGKAVVEIGYCGICGTDLHAFLSGAPYNPAICGHEWVGAVAAVDAAVDTCREGDRVALGARTACGRCNSCARGDAEHCEVAFAAIIGQGPLAAPHGGFAPRIAIDGSRLFEVANALSDEQAAILEPTAIAVHAVRRTDIRLGDSVIVIGGGPIGLLVGQCARAAGAGTLVLLEPQPARQAIGTALGFDLILDPRSPDAAERLAAHVGGAGADVVFECAGIPATINESVDRVRRGGVVSLVGVPSAPAEIMAAQWLAKEVRVQTSIAALREEFLIAQDLVVAGRVDVLPLHTDTVGLADMGSAFAALAESPNQVKVLVDPRR
ncbi:MAG: zinc-binding dehydrogenase [Pseudomonadota bacterium]